ncbi:MAG: SLBB domain-containing protein [Acidobacteriota bacterium]
MERRTPVAAAGFVHVVLMVAVAAVALPLPRLRTQEFTLPEDARFQVAYVPPVPRVPAALVGADIARRFSDPIVFVIGEVRSPGVVELRQTSSFAEVLFLAGSLTVAAGRRVVVLRPGQGPTAKVTLPGAAGALVIAGSLDHPPSLSDGDTVYIPPADVFAVLGEVRQPGVYILDATTSVIKAVALAGGLAEHGSRRQFTILRVIDGERVALGAAATDVIVPNDIVRVHRGLF